MNERAKSVNEESYRPQFVTKAFHVITGQAAKSTGEDQEPRQSITNGLGSTVDLMTIVQLPAADLKRAVSFYIDVLGLAPEYPERTIERNVFLQTVPRIGPGLHILETPAEEFRYLHGTANGEQEEYMAFYVQSLSQLHERLKRAGAAVVKEPSAGYMSFFDSEGHLLGAYERTGTGAEDFGPFETNLTGFRHVRLQASNLVSTAQFFERALGFERAGADSAAIYIKAGGEVNQPLIRLVQAVDPANPQPMHWLLDGRPKHALELHSKNIGALRERIVEHGGTAPEALEFTGCGGYLKFYTPDGQYLWVNQDRRYCDY